MLLAQCFTMDFFKNSRSVFNESSVIFKLLDHVSIFMF